MFGICYEFPKSTINYLLNSSLSMVFIVNACVHIHDPCI